MASFRGRGKPCRRPLRAFVFAVLALSGCRAEPLLLEELSPEAVVLDVPLVAQDELYECGLAALSALCAYYAIDVPDEKRRELLAAARHNRGLSGSELRSAMEDLGMEVFLFAGALDRSETGLMRHAERGRPAMVMIRAPSGSNHYCLFLGFDEPRERVFLLDPVQGRISVPVDTFERRWIKARRFTLLSVPRVDSMPIGTYNSAVWQEPSAGQSW